MRFSGKIIVYLSFLLLAAFFADSAEGKDRALLVGVENYREAKPALGATNDVRVMRDFLIKNLDFSSSSIVTLTDYDATANNIRHAFRNLTEESDVSDRVFFYFSGLGTRMPDKSGEEKDAMDELLAPYDIVLKNTADQGAQPLSNYILDDEISEWLTQLVGRRVVIVLDTGFYSTTSQGSNDKRWISSRFLRPKSSPQKESPTNPFNLLNAMRNRDSTNFSGDLPDNILNGITIITAARPGQEMLSVTTESRYMGALAHSLVKLQQKELLPLRDLQVRLREEFIELHTLGKFESTKKHLQEPEVQVLSKTDISKQTLFSDWNERVIGALGNPLSEIETTITLYNQGVFRSGDLISFNVSTKKSGYLYIIIFARNNLVTCPYPPLSSDIPLPSLSYDNRVKPGKIYSFPLPLTHIYAEEAGDYVIAAFVTEKPINLSSGEECTWNTIFNRTGLLQLYQAIYNYFPNGKAIKGAVSDQGPTPSFKEWQFAAVGIKVTPSSSQVNPKTLPSPIPNPALPQKSTPVSSTKQIYSKAVSMLIEQKQFAAAEQIALLSKQTEHKNFVEKLTNQRSELAIPSIFQPPPAAKYITVRRNSSFAEKSQTQIEEPVLQRATALTELGRQYDEEKMKRPPNYELLKALRDKIRAAINEFSSFLEELKKTQITDKKSQWLEASQSLQDTLRQLSQDAGQPGRVAAIYTVVGDQQLSLIVVTPQIRNGINIKISKAELEKLVNDYRIALQNPLRDPRPAAAKLYEKIFKPIEVDILPLIKGADGKEEPITLMWSLDGNLRYAPVSALWDRARGKYMVERFRNTVFTYRSRDTLRLKPDINWSAIGFGVSKQRIQSGITFSALPTVISELEIISDNSSPAIDSPLRGKTFLDEDFTERKMTDELLGQWGVVHIASHFRLQPVTEKNEGKSFLLLGSGELTLAQIVRMEQIFAGVQLLTLSGCNTAIGVIGDNGEEIDGFAVIAQDKGAQAVLASLWVIEDTSTGELMREFYARRGASNGQMLKAEALRKAQLALLNGKYKIGETPIWRLGPTEMVGAKNNQNPIFRKDVNAPFAHPYFWSSFILFGNWR